MNDVDPGRLVALYAVDALDDAESRRFERHLDACNECAAEVAELHEITAQLSVLGWTEPPPELRPDIMAALIPHTGPGLAAASRRHSRSSRTVRTRGLAAAAALAVAGGLAWKGIVTTPVPRPAGTSALPSDATTSRGKIDGGAASVTYSRSAGGLILHIDHLPPLGEGDSYQAWLIDPSGNATSEGPFTPDPSAHVTLRGTFTPSNASILAVTVEQAGGATRPSGRRYVISLP